jgi:F-type H+-transporting ATPase subunit delta
MQNPRLASRYAKSLIDLAVELNLLEQVYTDMQWLNGVCKSNRDFVNLLKSPIIKGETKIKILTAVTTGNISELTDRFNKLLVTKNREKFLPEITSAFITAYKKYKNIKTVHLTTAYPLSDGLRQIFIDQVKKSEVNSVIELDEKVNPDIIGGFVMQIGDRLVDASVAYDLKTISRQFDNNDFIYKVR